MAGKLNIAFLWHMHQPNYADPATGKPLLPWVRLHGVKGYLDMLAAVRAYPPIRVAFNFTPCLIQQLAEIADGETTDRYYDLSLKPAEDLEPEEQQLILKRFFSANWDTMVLRYPRYRELLYRRGRQVQDENLAGIAAKFHTQDWRDLQVWFNLTWFGWAAQAKYPEIVHLKRKDRDFTEAEKVSLLQLQKTILKEILPGYRAAWAEGLIEVATSPFYHPILPLLIDSSCAKISQPQDELPEPPFQRLNDAREQLQRGRDYIQEKLGKTPIGLWPSEGSVSPAVCELADEAGFTWLATDEAVLMATLGKGDRDKAIYNTYRAYTNGPTILFRDRFLSDAIGFRYARNTPKQSVDDLLGHLEDITKTHSDPSKGLVSIILDGENAWEYFPDGGEGFFTELYTRLQDHPKLTSCTPQQFLSENPSERVLPPIFPASWIRGSFRIWIGDPVKNTAWSRLRQTAETIAEQMRVSEYLPLAEKVKELLFTAEGSDWFWWYGEPNHSDFDDQFDLLFRLNQVEIYKLLGMPIPFELLQSISPAEAKEDYPLFPIQPILDGRETTFYEWVGARNVRACDFSGSMNFSSGLLEQIYFGLSETNLFLRLDPAEPWNTIKNLRILVRFIGSGQPRLEIEKLKRRSKPQAVWLNQQITEKINDVAYENVLEVALPFAHLPQDHNEVHFTIILLQGNLEIERWPRVGSFSCPCPTEDYLTKNWVI